MKNNVSDRAILRAFHFVDEDARVVEAVDAVKRGEMEAFLRAVIGSGESSWKLLQNLYVAGSDNQEMPLALELEPDTSAILAFVPQNMVQEYAQRMDAVFGSGATTVLAIRPEGVVCLKEHAV